jgi:hypothetical protein
MLLLCSAALSGNRDVGATEPGSSPIEGGAPVDLLVSERRFSPRLSLMMAPGQDLGRETSLGICSAPGPTRGRWRAGGGGRALASHCELSSGRGRVAAKAPWLPAAGRPLGSAAEEKKESPLNLPLSLPLP